jgi:DNA replication licensing factor MCM2
MDIGARNALDNNLNRRDVEIRRREGRVAGAFMYGLDDDANDAPTPVRRHRHIYEAQDMDQDEDGVVSWKGLSF